MVTPLSPVEDKIKAPTLACVVAGATVLVLSCGVDVSSRLQCFIHTPYSIWSPLRACRSVKPCTTHGVTCTILRSPLGSQGVWRRFLERFVSRRLIIEFGVDAHRLLAIRPTVLVERLALDVLVCITASSVVPLTLACHQCHIRLRTSRPSSVPHQNFSPSP